MKILLLVDIQNDFCPGGALAVDDGDGVVAVANRLMREGDFDLVVASQDFHPAGHASFASSHPGSEVFQTIAHRGGQQTLWPDHCVQGTPGAEFHPDLDVAKINHIAQKGMHPDIDSYSAFFDNEKGKETDLRAYLAKEAAKRGEDLADVEVFVLGLALDVCVAFTLKDAVSLGMSASLVLDGSRAVNITPGDDVRTLRELQSIGVHVVESRELLGQREVMRSLPREVGGDRPQGINL